MGMYDGSRILRKGGRGVHRKPKKAKKEKSLETLGFSRAIDGARTRGLDLGKVARYQLRHYRIDISFSRTRYILL